MPGLERRLRSAPVPAARPVYRRLLRRQDLAAGVPRVPSSAASSGVPLGGRVAFKIGAPSTYPPPITGTRDESLSAGSLPTVYLVYGAWRVSGSCQWASGLEEDSWRLRRTIMPHCTACFCRSKWGQGTIWLRYAQTVRHIWNIRIRPWFSGGTNKG